MRATLFLVLFCSGVAVSLAAAAIAYRVTYCQSVRVFKEAKHVKNAAMQSALFTFILFLVLTFVVAMFLSFSGLIGRAE